MGGESENKVYWFLWNFGNLLPDYTVLYDGQ
jgi:hypothetical protein